MRISFRAIIALSLCAALFLQAAAVTHAADPFDARNAQQGSTMEILIPSHDITAITATLDDAEAYFYPVTRQPNFDEPISRAEFLELMFKNSDFADSADSEDVESGTPAPAEAPDFPDVPPTHPHHQTIQRAARLGIIHGYEDGLFRPYATITRGQIAKVLVNAFDPPSALESAPEFPDVPQGHVFHGHIAQAVRAKLFQGYPDGLMRPNRDINFSEAETVIKRAMGQQQAPEDDEPKSFAPLDERDYYHAFVGIHRLSELKPKTLQLSLTRSPLDATKETDPRTERKTIRLDVTARTFPTISFNLASEKTELFADDSQAKTWAAINGAKANPIPEQLWRAPFIIPAEGEVTLGFGDKLYINGKYSGSHFGLDWANKEGTLVRASNTGKVTLAEWTPSYGNTIVIDHGQNIFTMYLHLSELRVKKGDSVTLGETIGLMGATGIATGSHLHFTHFVGDIIVDSQPWLDGEFH